MLGKWLLALLYYLTIINFHQNESFLVFSDVFLNA